MIAFNFIITEHPNSTVVFEKKKHAFNVEINVSSDQASSAGLSSGMTPNIGAIYIRNYLSNLSNK